MSRFIPEDIINRVRDSVDIVDLISRYFPLKKAGANYKALCPFHKEKTPSFSVSPSRQIFHCFGCGKGGNCFHFLMAIDRVSFPEAVRTLAKDVGIDVPEPRGPQPGEPDRDDRDRLYSANRRAADFFVKMLKTSAGGPAREYVQGRGISDEMAERCTLGWSPDSWDALLTAAAGAGVSAALLAHAGLAIARDDGSGYYDRFRNRLMFPIFDTQDRVIGFGARAMGDSEVKYINTPETPLFSKGRNLYGLNWARRAIVDAKRAAVVEGYTDVIMAHQHGCEAVVATLGTALTRDHIRLLRRFAERVDVVFDSDSAGQQAAERSMEVFLAEGAGDSVAAGLDVRIATLTGGKDPCELIAEDGPAAFTDAIDAATDVYTRKIELASRRHDLETVEGKTKAIDEVLALVAQVPNAVGRQLRIDRVLRALADRFDVEDRALHARLAQLERRRRGAPAEDTRPAPAGADDPAERGVIEALLAVPETAGDVFEELDAGDFAGAKMRQLFELAKSLYDTEGHVNASRVLAEIEDPAAASFVSGVLDRPPRPEMGRAADDCVRQLLRRRSERELRQLRREYEAAKAAGNQPLADDLSARCLKLQQHLHREVLAR